MMQTFFQDKTIVLTGAAGFIGSHLSERFLSLGSKIIAIDNFSLGHSKNLTHCLKHVKFHFLNKDIVNDHFEILEHLKNENIDEIWHFAANSDISAGVNNSDVDLKNTFLTSFNMLKIAHKLNIKKFIFASTSAIYGDMNGKVMYEHSGPCFPISNYGAMKLASEASISAACESYLKHAWIFRFPNVVGGKLTHGIIYDLLRKLNNNPLELEVLGDGCQQKQYLHVSELIDAMIHIRVHSSEKLNYFNLGVSDTHTSVSDIVSILMNALNSSAKIKYTGGEKGWVGDVPKFTFSTQKLNALGWCPRLTSSEAVKLAIEEIIKE